MKTQLMIIGALMLMLMTPGQQLSAQFGQTAPELDKVVRAIPYPAAWSEWSVEGNVTVAFEIDQAGKITAMDAWGDDQMLIQYAKRHVKRNLRKVSAVSAEPGVQAYRVSFRMDNPDPVASVTPPAPRFSLEQLLRDELFTLEESLMTGKASVVVKTNGSGMIEDVRIWGENPVMVSRLQKRLNGLSGRFVRQNEKEQLLRYDLVLK